MQEGIVVYPTIEKGDRLGVRVTEPLFVPLHQGERIWGRWLTLVFSCSPLDSAAAMQLLKAVRVALRGVKDVRGARRETAERVAQTRGRAVAGKVLRHEEGSRQTTRYTTTRDGIAKMRRALNG